mmetsp:Transcript_54310/g.87925  ORF Transcript_54310/g.87925 Transcript_54310/m.87925 type:complete len:112 (+) Transcript_54310:164-499(+)
MTENKMTGPSSKLKQSVRERDPPSEPRRSVAADRHPNLSCHKRTTGAASVSCLARQELMQQVFLVLLLVLLVCQDLDDFELRIRREEHFFLTGNCREMSNVLGSHRFNHKN